MAHPSDAERSDSAFRAFSSCEVSGLGVRGVHCCCKGRPTINVVLSFSHAGTKPQEKKNPNNRIEGLFDEREVPETFSHIGVETQTLIMMPGAKKLTVEPLRGAFSEENILAC